MGLLSFLHSLVVDPPPSTRQASSRHTVSNGPRRTAYLWQERGWTRSGDTLTGYYRTRRGAFRGRIENYDGDAEYYIISPPRALLSGPHGLCFRERDSDEYYVHFNIKPSHPDQGVLYIERLLSECLQ